jgi:uncharacterized protein (TIGR02231 family)
VPLPSAPSQARFPLNLWACAALLLFSTGALAQDAVSRIARVTVYPGVAAVERVAKVAAGARSLTIACLPASLDAQSLQIQADSGVRVGEFHVLTEDRDVATACASPLDGRIRELEDQIAALKAEAGGLQLVDQYLKSVAAGPATDDGTPAARTASPPPAQIGSTADVLRKTGQDTRARSHQLQRRQEALELSLKPLLAERERVASQRTRVVSVTVNLAAERDGELRLNYQVRGPGWQPSYRATLDTTKTSVQIERLALVAQNSGEDWSNVQLLLSTGQPQRATQGRLPRPWTLDVAPPPPPAAAMPMAAMAPAPAAPAPKAMERRQAEDMPSFDVSTVDKGFATEFAVPQRISVPSNGQRITLALGTHQAPARLLVRAAPGVEEAAYLVADMVPPPGVWPAGSVGLYRDGAYVGTGRLDFAALPSTAPGEGPRTSLSFGRDELVQVRAEAPQQMTGSTGLTGARTERQTRRSYQVENRHKTAIDLQVLHAAPVSRNEKIEVESRYTPQPAELAWNGTPGTIAWRQNLGAGASASFAAEHWVRYPKDIQLQERP